MKIQSLSLERYGAFTDRVLTFDPDARLHVVIGPNEAGKSSALSAIADLLFGFGKFTPYDFMHDAKVLRVGGLFRTTDGRDITIRRRKGNKSTLLDRDDNPLPDDFLAPLLGSITRDIFSSEFGLNAQSLRDGGEKLLTAGGRLTETLAASSAGLTVLSDLRRRLSDEADLLFAPRRSGSREFYLATDRYDDATRQLAQATVTPDALKAALANVAAAEARHADYVKLHETTGRDLARLQRATRTRSHLARLDALREDLAGFASLPTVSDTDLARWQAALVEFDRITTELQRLDQDDAVDRASIAALNIDEAILSRAETIDTLARRMEVIRKEMDDLPRRVTEQSLAQDALQECARQLGIGSAADLLAQLPTELALAEVRDLIAETRNAERVSLEAQRQLHAAVAERERLQREEPLPAHVVDPAPLRLQLQVFANVPLVADRVRTERSACDREAGQIDTALAGLDPRLESLVDLAARGLPDDATMAEHERSVSELAGELQRAKAKLVEADERVELIGIEVARFERSGAVVTREDLLQARADRNAAIASLEPALDDATMRRANLDEVKRLTEAADRVADQLVTDSERAARFSALQDQQEDAKRDAARAADALRDVNDRNEAAREAWAALWQPAAIMPRQPGDMRKWLARILDLQHRAQAIDDRRARLKADSDWLAESRPSLQTLLATLGGQADAMTPMDLLYRDAELRLGEISSAWTELQKRAVTTERAGRDVVDAEAALARAADKLKVCREALPAAFAGIGVAATAALGAAEVALRVWGGVGDHRQRFEIASQRINGINRDIAAFDAEVRSVVAAVSPDLASRPVMDALKDIAQRLAQAQRADAQRSSRQDAVAARSVKRQAVMAAQAPIDALLATARSTLGAPDNHALLATLDRVTQHNQLTRDLAAVGTHLRDSADGMDEAALRAEQADLDHDLLDAEVARLSAAQRQSLDEIGKAHAAIDQACRERDELSKGRDAVGAARERADAAGEIRDVVNRWLVRAAAMKLADRAIERHRQMVQDPLLQRASELFAISSAGAFSGLALDFGDDDQPVVVAVRHSQERVGVKGLSEGTRDQLFLSLRLALLERRTVETLPFIGDDLLASFDERRTASTLSLLASTTADRQAIIFTHHRHVAEIARSMAGQPIAVVEL